MNNPDRSSARHPELKESQDNHDGKGRRMIPNESLRPPPPSDPLEIKRKAYEKANAVDDAQAMKEAIAREKLVKARKPGLPHDLVPPEVRAKD